MRAPVAQALRFFGALLSNAASAEILAGAHSWLARAAAAATAVSFVCV